jgi:NAD(P)H-hydrate epimerase
MLCKKVAESLPQQAYQAKQVQQNEAIIAEKAGIEMYALMQAAGNAVFSCVQQHVSLANYQRKPAMLILCGKGNNGGDGYVVASAAAKNGWQVNVCILAKETDIKGDAKLAFQAMQHDASIAISFITNAAELTNYWLTSVQHSTFDVLIDGLLGTGFSGELSPLFSSAISFCNDYTKTNETTVFSIDIPSGLCANTGNVHSVAINANFTVTFIAVKQGLLTAQAADHVGVLYLAGLDINQHFQRDISSQINVQGPNALPKLFARKRTLHKGNVGLLLCIGGNIGMPGAIRLASEAALRCGAALVAVTTQHENQTMLLSGRPELMLAGYCAETVKQASAFNKAKILLIGPGLGRDSWAEQLVNLVCQQSKITVVDADAFYFVAKHKLYKSNWILTPHPGEAAMLLNCSVSEIEADRFAAVRNITKQYGGICVLKGAGSLLCDGEQIWINTSGNPGMASGGMGDVLSGIIAALLMQMPDPFSAVRLAVYLHGLAADNVALQNGERGMLASDLFPILHKLVNEF